MPRFFSDTNLNLPSITQGHHFTRPFFTSGINSSINIKAIKYLIDGFSPGIQYL